jgi:hypothetical protein
LKGEKDIIDYSFHFNNDEYCVKRWEGVGDDDKDVRS